MASTLLEALNTGMQKASAETGPTPGTTAATQNLLATKATGRAVAPGTSPAISSQAEKLAISTDEAEKKQEGLKDKLAISGLAGQEEAQQQNFDIAQKQGIEKMQTMEADFNRRSSDMLQQFERGNRKIDDAKDALALEVMGQQARLGNAKYINQIDQLSKQMGLDSEIKFKEEMARTVLEDDLDFMNDERAHAKFMSSSDDDFKREIGSIDISTATQMAKNQLKGQQERAKMEGIGGMFSAGISGYAAYDKASTERSILDKKAATEDPAAVAEWEAVTGKTHPSNKGT